MNTRPSAHRVRIDSRLVSSLAEIGRHVVDERELPRTDYRHVAIEELVHSYSQEHSDVFDVVGEMQIQYTNRSEEVSPDIDDGDDGDDGGEKVLLRDLMDDDG